MNVNELMIGDWVRKGERRVYFQWSALNMFRALEGHITEKVIKADGIAPVPITTEIINKNAYEYEGSKYYLLPMDESYNVCYDYAEKTLSIVCGDGYSTKVEWMNNITNVHQLQQVLRLWGLKETAREFAV